MSTKIEWTDRTWNPIVVGGGGWWCEKIDEQCSNCYAEALNANGFFGGNGLPYHGSPPQLILRQEMIDRWARLRTSQRHFITSMTDPFGAWVPREWQHRILDGMAFAPRQTFQILTKRPDVALAAITDWVERRGISALPPHIWIGVSVGNQLRADERREAMRRIPATVRFVSYEPALGPANWQGWEFLSWLIAGGESGPNARPANLLWYRQTRDWCVGNGVSFFFKQHGNWLATEQGIAPQLKAGTPVHFFEFPFLSIRIGKKVAGRLLDGRTWDEFPSIQSTIKETNNA